MCGDIYFISGHLDLTAKEFKLHYEERIKSAMDKEGRFVVGDAPGADTMAQDFIFKHGGFALVFHMLDEARNNVGFSCAGHFKTDKRRDETMTLISDADIAWVRPGREKSGTQANIDRRA